MTTPTLEALLVDAIDGDASAVALFLQAFLDTPLCVPDRHQKVPLTNQPTYPSELFAMMGVRDGDRNIIPCFYSEERLQSWTSSRLAYSTVQGIDLCTRAPEHWWIVLSPGEDASKEFSPWEIGKLRQGAQAIPEIVSDLTQCQTSTVLEVERLNPELYPQLRHALLTAAHDYPSITSLFMAREHASTPEGDRHYTLLAGFLCPDGDLDAIRSSIQERCDVLQIGDEQVRVIGAASAETLEFSVFTQLQPFWNKPSTFRRFASLLGLKA